MLAGPICTTLVLVVLARTKEACLLPLICGVRVMVEADVVLLERTVFATLSIVAPLRLMVRP